jgi:chromate transporter
MSEHAAMPVSGAPKTTLLSLARVLAASGNSTVGGGTATIVEIERELIDRRGWISRPESQVAYAISRLTPGTNLLAYCVAVGWRLGGSLGAGVALLAVSLPGAVAAVLLTFLVTRWKAQPALAAALSALLAAAVAIMIGAIWAMMRPFFLAQRWQKPLLFSLCGLLLAAFTSVSPLTILVTAAVMGAVVPDSTRE